MEDPAVTDPTTTGLDADPLRHSLRADESDSVGGIAQKDEIAAEKNEEDAISLREDGSDCADGIATNEEKVAEKIDEDASSLTAEKSDFVDDTTRKEEAVETSDEEHTGETVQKEEKTPEEPIEKGMKIEEDAISLRVGSDFADDIAQKEENVDGDAVSFRAAEFDFTDETSHLEDTGETIQNGEKIPEKSVTDGLEIQEGSVCADNAANEEETSPENIQERETHSGVADDNDTNRNEEIDGIAKKQEDIPGKSTIDKNEKIENDATRLMEEGSGFADDTDKEEEKSAHNIEEDKASYGAESSDFAGETLHKDETDVDGQKEEKSSEKPILEEIEKIQDGATSSRADDSDCVDDTTQAEEKSSVKSTNDQIQEKTDENAKKEDNIPEKTVVEKDKKIQDQETRLRALGYDFVNETAQEQDKTPMNSPTEQMQEGTTSLRSRVADSTEETARKVPNNHAVVKEPVQKEENSQPASAPPPTPERTTNPLPGAAAPSTVRPAGLGRAAPLLEPAARAAQQPRVNGTTAQMQSQQTEDSNGEVEEYDETREQLQMIRVKFLRLAHRLGQTPHNVVVAQVLYRLGLAEQLRGRNGGRVGAFSFDRASAMAEQLEASGQEPLDFSCTIMVLGKSGVGKSATINSIFDEQKFCTDAFQTGTQKVQDVVGTVQGIKVRVIDTPGLLSSWSDQRQNVKILQSVKRFIKKTPPDIVLYLDRLDMQSRDFGDMPLLRTITEIFGPSIWFNAIVVLTHAASAPPDGPNGAASGYDMFVTQRSHVVQQNIRQAAGDMRLMNPISLVENHSACRINRAGQRVLPNGQVWKPHLLLLSFASKILAEANTLLKLQDSSPGKPSATRSRAPPLPFLLSSLLQSRPQLKLPGEQVGGDEDDDLDSSSDSDNETEYDDLPPFTRLTKAQVATLTKAQRKAYFDELAYREKLFMKNQLKEERRQRRMMRNMAAAGPSVPSENVEESDSVIPPAPMPDLALPASFDSSNPAHRYRCLDSASQWIVRPVLDTHGWDHDVGYEGVNLERFFVVKNKLPVAFSGQASKDKKDANIQMEVNSSLSHGKGKAMSMGFDLQTVGKDMAYTLRGETKFLNHRRNKATAGLSATILGDALSTGVKLEDKLIINKCLRMVVAGGAMSGRGDVAYGGSLEAQLRDRDYPIGRFLSTLGLSIMDWHGDLAIGGNIQSQVPIGRSTNLIARANLNNRGAGQVNIRLNSSEQLQIALFGLVPLLRKVVEQFSQMQHGQQ